MILFPTGITITTVEHLCLLHVEADPEQWLRDIPQRYDLSVFETPEECGTLIHFVNENSRLPGRRSWKSSMRGLRM